MRLPGWESWAAPSIPSTSGIWPAPNRCARRTGLDAVVFIPAGSPVFKRDRGVTPADDRLAMCRLATESNPAFDVSAMEIERGGDTYTVDTLRELRAHYPDNVELVFITGADAVAKIFPLARKRSGRRGSRGSSP